MNIALHDADSHNFPNLVLMKLSAWHKSQGDKVERFMPLYANEYDLIYSSKVFSWTKNDIYLPENTIKGGTGYKDKLHDCLPDEVEHFMPDYSLYPDFNASLGFTTRGCIRNCPWCVVPMKEGKLRAHAEIEEFLRPDSRDVILMDNNILAHEHGIKQLEKSINLGLRIDCNQGMDARMVTHDDAIARLLAKVHWIKFIRFSCDTVDQIPYVQKAVEAIRKYDRAFYYEFFCYVLVKEIPDALERVEFLRELGIKPFAQPYRDIESNKEPLRDLRNFARWVNHKAIFNSCSWDDYKYKGNL